MISIILGALFFLPSQCCCWTILICTALFFYAAAKVKYPKLKGKYSQPTGIVFHVKRVTIAILLAVISIIRRQKRRKNPEQEFNLDNLQTLGNGENAANLTAFYANDKHGNTLSIRFCRRLEGKAEVFMLVRLADGRVLSRNGFVCDESPITGDELDTDVVAADGLRIQTINPLKTFRVLFSGLMALNRDEAVSCTDKQYREVTLRLWCKSLADAAHRTVDYHPWLLAEAVAAEPWSMELLKYLLKVHEQSERFEQAMEMRGRIDISPIETEESSTEQLELTLHGIRQRIIGDLDLRTIDTAIVHKARFDNGFIVSFVATSLNTTLTHLVEGFLHHPNGFVYAINWTDYHLARLTDDGNVQRKYCFSFSAGSKLFSLSVEMVDRDSSPLSPHGKGVLFRNIAKFSLTGSATSNGFGHVELWRLHGDQSKARSLFPRNKLATRRYLVPKTHELEYCVGLTEESCTNGQFTGGKASKLAALIAARNPDDDFEVPPGFAITVEAYYRQMKRRSELRSGVDKVVILASKLSNTTDESEIKNLQQRLENECSHLSELISSTPLESEVEDAIEKYLDSMFGDVDKKKVLLAVRSSAVGEDGSEASGAGQMETFLGVSGKSEVFDKLKNCWASHFAYRAVEYRRQFCGKIDSPMAVLVQRLVPADVAGVLFTRHPDTGSTSRVVINASYGLGESVVSGTVDVDTITVQKLDKIGHNVKIRYDNLGKKDSILKATDQGVVHETNEGSSQCCLSEDEIRRLVKVGESIERIFGAGRDTEFALSRPDKASKAQIHILQARPITTSDMEQEWELLQEFDSPLASDSECLTTANVQEVMPDILCPFGVDGWDNVSAAFDYRSIDFSIKPRRRALVSRTVGIFGHRPFINYTMFGFVTSEVTKESLDMAIFGRRLDEIPIETIFEQNDTSSALFRAISEIRANVNRLTPYAFAKKAEPLVESLKVPSANDPAELYKQFTDIVNICQMTMIGHLDVSEASGVGNALILTILEKDLSKRTPTQFVDIATLLSSCTDVFSADVPTMMQSIVSSIAESPEGTQKFLALERKEAAKWLGSSDLAGSKTNTLFEDFMKKHGHRCVKDLDIRETSWNQEPEKVVDALQTMLRAGGVSQTLHSNKKELTVEEAIENLQTPLNNFQKFLLKIVVPRVRVAVGRREWSKSITVKANDILRQTTVKIAQILTKKGFLPDSDLVFFLTQRELGQLIQRRSPKIISRAIRRRKLFPRFREMHFQEVAVGYPKPIESSKVSADLAALQSDGKSVVLKGTSVGLGSITGKARVVTSLAEANTIERGDILIVPYTDVGWTPYFPLISGLVTELGGLVSHGAVVAREYGLPCIVGCKQATHIAKTGDQVTIDGSKGQCVVVRSS